MGRSLVHRRIRMGFAAGVLIGAPLVALRAQIVGPSTGGAGALAQSLRMVGHTKRVLMVAAHPDDEDTELITYLVRHEGAETAYLSLSRGEGGQNLIGVELGEALGLLRSEELLAARRLDGGRQYFTRAFDFGFSKTVEETARFWPRDSVLKDVVRIIRRFHPQVMVSIFSGTPRDGHGQHQMAGWAAQEAFKVAGDPTRFPELRDEGLAPWTPQKLYRSARFDTTGSSTALEGGFLDPDIGQSYRQIAMRGRSLHRSQDMGVLQEIGPSTIRLALIDDRTGKGAALFAGIDTSAAAADGGTIESKDQRLRRSEARAISASVIVDGIADEGRLVRGGKAKLRLSVWNAGRDSVRSRVALLAPLGWEVKSACLDQVRAIAPGSVDHCSVDVVVAPDAPLTTPYFLARPRIGALYQWTGSPEIWGDPFDPPLVQAAFTLTPASGEPVTVTREVFWRYRDQAIGEIRRPLTVLPRVDVKLDPGVKVWPTSVSQPQKFTVTLQHAGRDTTRGSVQLELPAGWPAVNPQTFELSRPDERESVTFDVAAPKGLAPGSYTIRAVAKDAAGQRYEQGVITVDYPHIRPSGYVVAATSGVHAAPVSFPAGRRIGYIRGAADRVPEALANVGLPVELLDPLALERAELGRYDVIIVGSRAYETDPALLENNTRLLEYVRRGGHLVVQYQQQPFFFGNYAPASLTVAPQHDRVTDETAPVTVLRPNDPILLGPNKITGADWDGWVQERGLYFAHTWDKIYTPILEMADPGSPPLQGELLVAAVGKGTYVYTGLSFFRQLPAGVPGAFRLFLNLLDLKSRAVVP
ncbi:MAG: NEW3 domain-containing protein [Gemmatimonadota bacterium]